MMYAYDEMYLDDAMGNLGEAFDYAVNICGFSPDGFMDLFVSSGFSDYFGKGNPKYVSGKSGTELVMDIMLHVGEDVPTYAAQIEYDCSPEYWSGWILAYYQWATGKTYREIHEFLSLETILSLYPTLHEAPEDKFVDVVERIYLRREYVNKLQYQRKLAGLSQRELSNKSGVNLRTLQQYELGSKSISKASVVTCMALADSLGCDVRDLLD